MGHPCFLACGRDRGLRLDGGQFLGGHVRGEAGQVQRPRPAAAPPPGRECLSDVDGGLPRGPAVDLLQVGAGRLGPAELTGPPEVLDLVAGRAQADHADQALDAGRLVVGPDLMALDRVGGAVAATDLAAARTLMYQLVRGTSSMTSRGVAPAASDDAACSAMLAHAPSTASSPDHSPGR